MLSRGDKLDLGRFGQGNTQIKVGQRLLAGSWRTEAPVPSVVLTVQSCFEAIQAKLNDRAPMQEARQRMEPNLQLIKLKRGRIQLRGGDLHGPQSDAPGAQSAVFTQLHRVTE